jgi:hypothetical protein
MLATPPKSNLLKVHKYLILFVTNVSKMLSSPYHLHGDPNMLHPQLKAKVVRIHSTSKACKIEESVGVGLALTFEDTNLVFQLDDFKKFN